MLQLRKGKVLAHDGRTYLVVKRPVIGSALNKCRHGVPPKWHNEVALDQEWIHDVFVAHRMPLSKYARATRTLVHLAAMVTLVLIFLQIGRWVQAGMPFVY